MLVICSYCRRTIVDDPAGGTQVSHGMCPACAEHFEALWRGMSLSEYLDELPMAVLVVNGEGRVVAANARLATLFGRDRAGMSGLLEGEALACVHSRLPGGCGKTVHCRECTIRRSVERVTETGVPIEGAPAFLNTDAGRLELRISVQAQDGLVKVVVEELSPPVAKPEPR
jgi:PAS domain-containing protein